MPEYPDPSTWDKFSKHIVLGLIVSAIVAVMFFIAVYLIVV